MTSPAVATPRADDSDAWWRSIRDIRRDDRAFVFLLTILAGVIYWATNPARVELDGFVPLADALLHGKSLFGRREDSELRACAAVALGRINTPQAQESLRRATNEKDVIVRNAANRALRGGSAPA